MITDRRKFTIKLTLYEMSSFDFYRPLESIHNHFLEMYAAYKKATPTYIVKRAVPHRGRSEVCCLR